MKDLNPYILVAMDWKNKTQEELKNNAASADAAYETAWNIAWDTNVDAANATDAESNAALASDSALDAQFWITQYFEITGEKREDYEAALNKNVTNKG